MGYRWRRMYYLTGLPGWIRFGYSPGWIGRSASGLPPTAEWLISTGSIPSYTGQVSPNISPVTPTPILTKEQEKLMLEQQAKTIESELEAIKKRLEELRKGSTSQTSFNPYLFSPYTYTPTPEEELASLEAYKKQLDDEIKGVEARIEELKKIMEKKKT
ncbi:hypothetical protein DRO26_00140 [Candidatus Bathyarchaeota archaeon]|nr:MAG: hypothetical protein DRO26_00140 [Candidatus Bathyarchaeota archaeon]